MIKAVLFDRDGTLIHDVPYNGDPALVRPIDGIAQTLTEARSAGLLLGVVTNQSAIARGLITPGQVTAVNTEVERRLGPFGTWQICPHQDADACRGRKPLPELIIHAAHALHVEPAECLVIGDRSTDLDAATAAGAQGILISRWLHEDRAAWCPPVSAQTLSPASPCSLSPQGGHADM